MVEIIFENELFKKFVNDDVVKEFEKKFKSEVKYNILLRKKEEKKVYRKRIR